MIRYMPGWLLLAATLFASALQAGQLTIAAASDLKFAMDVLVANFRDQHPAVRLTVVYGSSGKLQAQIRQGAPYDLYFSADIAYPQALADEGLAASAVVPYARGRLVLWSRQQGRPMRLDELADPAVHRIAIANPRHAPYGQRAIQVLQRAGLWHAVRHRLVQGESVSHAAQFVQSGNARAGLIALSLARAPALSRQGTHLLIPEHLHEPLVQGVMITRHAADKVLAQAFLDALRQRPAHAVLRQFGFMPLSTGLP